MCIDSASIVSSVRDLLLFHAALECIVVLRFGLMCWLCSRRPKASPSTFTMAGGEFIALKTPAETSSVQVTLLRCKSTGRVLFLEAGKDFVDTLISFLTLPLGTVMKLLLTQGVNISLCSALQPFCGTYDDLFDEIKEAHGVGRGRFNDQFCSYCKLVKFFFSWNRAWSLQSIEIKFLDAVFEQGTRRQESEESQIFSGAWRSLARPYCTSTGRLLQIPDHHLVFSRLYFTSMQE